MYCQRLGYLALAAAFWLLAIVSVLARYQIGVSIHCTGLIILGIVQCRITSEVRKTSFSISLIVWFFFAMWGPFSESISIVYGKAWFYADQQFGVIPYYLPPLWGFTVVSALYFEHMLKGDKKEEILPMYRNQHDFSRNYACTAAQIFDQKFAGYTPLLADQGRV